MGFKAVMVRGFPVVKGEGVLKLEEFKRRVLLARVGGNRGI